MDIPLLHCRTTALSGLAISAILLAIGSGAVCAEDTAPPPAPPVVAPATPATPPVKIERLANGDVRLGAITLHRKERVLSFPATMNMGRA